MNNEPVAWMNPKTLECGHGGNVDWEDTGCIPLYARPVKELTDFEILQISAGYSDRLHFARAILRKAQEK